MKIKGYDRFRERSVFLLSKCFKSRRSNLETKSSPKYLEKLEKKMRK